MSFSESISSVFSKYATFSGRARRSEFWYFYLFQLIISLGLTFLSRWDSNFKYIQIVFGLAIFVPYMAVTVRRLHDIGKSGWTLLWFMVPWFLIIMLLTLFVTIITTSVTDLSTLMIIIVYGIFILLFLVISIWLIVWLARDSQPGENQWGPNPKEQPETPLDNNIE